MHRRDPFKARAFSGYGAVSGGWTHEVVYATLRSLHGGSDPKHGSYAFLYPQRLGESSAVLYAPDSKVWRRPLHLRPDGASAQRDLFAALEPSIEFKYQETKPAGFTLYAVTDWSGFARALRLRPTS